MVVAANTAFVAEPDLGAGLLGHPPDQRELFLLPSLHPCRILLVGPVQRTLATQAQLLQQTARAGATQLDLEFLPDQPAHYGDGPERELKPVLQGCLIGYQVVQAFRLIGPQLHRTAKQLFGLQRTEPAAAVGGELVVDAAFAQAPGANDLFRVLAFLDGVDRADPDHFQGLVIEFASVEFGHPSS